MIQIELSWPDKALSPNGRLWCSEDDEALRAMHGTMPIPEIARVLGRTAGSIRSRITNLGIAKQVYWTDEETAALAAFYEKGKGGAVIDLEAFAKSVGRLKSNVCRKARQMGLGTDQRRKIVEFRKERKGQKSKEEISANRSAILKKRHQERGHPMLGRKHTDEARKKISAASKASHLFMSEDQKSERILKALKTKVERYGSVATKRTNTTWAAGWREIGGYKKYYRSRWEANYARYLQWLKDNGQITDWKHEPETYWFNDIKRGVRSYLPDFRVWENDGRVVLHEVKGWMDSRSKTTLKRMKKYYPSETVLLIDEKAYKSIRRSMMAIIPDWEDSERDRR